MSGNNFTHEPLLKKTDIVKVELRVIRVGIFNWNASELYLADNFKM
jgi:hypothetical protein